MTVNTWLVNSIVTLRNAGIITERVDCLVLLADELGKDKSWILTYPEHELQIEQLEKLNKKIAQRALHIPLAYIRSKTEFYGRDFIVSSIVLVPRPESETIISLLKTLSLEPRTTIADIGTGSGALAITAKLELPETKIVAIDIDQRCLEIARQNAQKYHVNITLLRSDLLAKLHQRDDQALVLVCNLPYVPTGYAINQAATHEPKLALFGGDDGLDLYRKLFTQVKKFSQGPKYILCEALPAQHTALADIAKVAGFSLEKTDDFIQVFVPNY